MAWICDKTGQQKCEIKKLSYNGTFMEVSSITVTVESAAPIDFAIGDYIDWDYDGLRYTLDMAAGVEKQARRNTIGKAFVYDNLVFLSPLSAADNVDFLDVILGNTVDFMTNTEFSFYGTAWDYAKRLEANLCRLYGSGSWKVRIWTNGTCYDDTPATGIDTGAWENKLVDVSGIKCMGGFQQIYDLWGCAYVFSVNNGVNYVDFYDDFEQAQARKESGVDKIFAYGKGNGLYKIRHTQDTDHVLVTRLRPYGSSDNLPANYYLNSPDYHVDGNESSELAISRLMLPASQWTKNGVKCPANAYLERNTDLYGVREGIVAWDGSDPELGEIKPTIYGLTIQDLLNLMAAGTSYRPNTAKWPDPTQRIDKIIVGAAPTDNGAVAEAGYDFTVVEAAGSLAAHSFGSTKVNKEVEFNDLVMGTTPSVSHLADFRIVPTSENKIAASFDLPSDKAALLSTVTAYLTPYVNGVKVEDATYPCAVSVENIENVVGDVTYTKRVKISLLDATENPIVFSTMRTGSVTFRIVAHVEFNTEVTSSFNVLRDEYAVGFNLLRGNKAIDKFFSVTIPQVGFDLAAAVTGSARLCMRSGANQPREFAIVASSVRYNESTDTWYLRCKRVVDQSIKTYFPNSDAVIATGDEYYLAGITMPSLYVEIAAGKLKDAALAWLELHSKPRMLSSVDVDNKIMAEESIVLKEGMSLPLSDSDLGITPQTQESRVIDNIRIEEGSDAIRTFTITLRDKKEKSSLDAAIRGATSNFATNTSVSEAVSAVEGRDHGSLSGRDMPNQHPISAISGLEEALAALTFFEADGNGNVKLKDEYGGLWTRGFLTAGGVGQSGGGGGGGIDLARLWQSLQNNDATTDIYNVYKISTAHLPGLGAGLAYTDNHEAGTSLETTLSIADGYKLPTVEEWNSIAGNVGALQSLQAQIDAVASRDNFDELTASAIFSDVIAATDIYGSLHGNAETATNAQTAATAEKATKDASGNVITFYYAKASDLTSVSNRVSTLESRQNWDNIFGLDENGNVYVKKNGNAARGFWSYGFITAGGVGQSSGGGGSSVDLARLWRSLQNNDPTTDIYNNFKISIPHLPTLGAGLAYTTNQGESGATGENLTTTLGIETGYKLPTTSEWSGIDSNFTTVGAALQSIQAQIDSVASRDNFDDITASAIFADVIAVSDIYGSLHGNAETATSSNSADSATNASYLVNSSYSKGSESIPVYFSGGLPVACPGASLFSGLSSTSVTNLSITIAGQTRSLTALYATYDASGNTITSYYAKASDLTAVSNRVSTLEARQNWDEIFGLDENGNVYVKKNGSAARGFWTYGFVTAGGVGSSGGGGGDVDLTRLWKSMQNQDTINTYNDYKISTAHLPALGTGLAYTDNQGSGSSLATTLSIAAGYKLPTTEEWANVSDSLNGLQALQAQIDSVASRDCFDELAASALFADVLTASKGYFSELYGVLHGNADSATSATSAGSAGSATTASYLVGSSYGAGAADKPVYFSGGLPVALSATVGSASLPVFLSAGTITSCTAASIFSSLTSSAATNLSVTVSGQNRTVTLYATYDSASENIASTFSIVSSALQSLQSQIDSVATRNDFDELVASVIYADTISAASFYGALHGNADTATNATNATYATYDTASENIALNFSTVGAALKSLQAQIDSVAASRSFDELTVGAGYFDMLSIGANLDVAGTIYSVKGIYSSGYVTAGAVGASSDRRLKNNIVTISKERAEDVIMALSPCEWVWNEKNAALEGRKFAGFIAQDVQKVLPDTVLDSREELLMFHNVFHGYEVRMLQDHERRIKALELANE